MAILDVFDINVYAAGSFLPMQELWLGESQSYAEVSELLGQRQL